MEKNERSRRARLHRRLILLENRKAKRHKTGLPPNYTIPCTFVTHGVPNLHVPNIPIISCPNTTQHESSSQNQNIMSRSIVNTYGSIETTTSVVKPLRTRRKNIQRNTTGKSFDPWNFGAPTETCACCGAILWYEERTIKSKTLQIQKYSLCCQEGKVKLPLLMDAPYPLQCLLGYNGGRRSSIFRENIRAYNSIFSFTSIGGNVDRAINSKPGPYIFRINGQNHHKIGSLLPMHGSIPKFAQLYIYDTDNEVSNRIKALAGDNSSSRLDPNIVSELLEMLNENNVLAKAFRMARDRFRNDDFAPIRMRLLSTRSKDPSVYNLPTTSEVAALIVGDLNDTNCMRDVIVEHRSDGLQRIYELHPSFMAMQYPLLFPYGEDGYHINIKYTEIQGRRETSRKRVTMREYYAFRIQQRSSEGKTLLCSGRLLQQYLVDAYTCIEEDRLRWIRMNQTQLRAELYKGLRDAVLKGDSTPSSVGKRIVLPSSFTGGPRYMAQNFQDAMAICKWFGNPDLFLTFTTNPKWPEIQSFLNFIPGQKPEERPDVVSRVFKIKLNQLLKDLVQGHHFGRVQAAIYTIEFQKRGLPHAHIVLFLHSDDKYPSATEIDSIISAEIPDISIDPIGYTAVAQFMMHGPCGAANFNSPCMTKGTCSKHFPKKYSSETNVDEQGFPIYKRREIQRYVEKNGIKLDNRFVVPYNRDLVVKYQAHINVEWCNKSISIKYLFKYLSKGPDRSSVILQETRNQADGSQIVGEVEVDEIQMFLNCRYLSPCEACWRIFQFEIHYRSISVERLSFHLPDEHFVTFKDGDNLNNVLNRFDVENTMFTQWMETNSTHADARELTYAEFPTQWVWQPQYKKWKRRQAGKCIGRIVYAHPASGERFYLRMLLNFVKGPCNFEEIKTINGHTHPTYKAECYALGLLDGDNEWHEAIKQAAQWAGGAQLRELFVIMLLFCEVSDPQSLWESNWEFLSEDILFQQRKILQFEELSLNETQLQAYALREIEKVLLRNNRSLKDYPSLPNPNQELLQGLENRLVMEELSYNREKLIHEHEDIYSRLNLEQLHVYETVVNAVYQKRGGFFFVYGAGGTGKTFLYKALLTRLRSEGKIVLAVASSGVASLLLPGGRTAHSRFAIPIKINEYSTCEIHQGTQLAELMERASLIIWDEAPMDHRHAFEALDKTMKDIVRFSPEYDCEKPFGGKIVLLGGDFRQTLPVVQRGTRQDVVHASISNSPLWTSCEVFVLTQNMRIKDSDSFSKWVLDVGEGKLPKKAFDGEEEPSWIDIPHDLLIPTSSDPVACIVSTTYPDLVHNYIYPDYLRNRGILTPTNQMVDEINSFVLKMLPSGQRTYLSSDSVCKANDNVAD